MSTIGDPWEINMVDLRGANHKSVFIVFCEDGAVEPAYLRAMSSNKVQITCIPNSGQHHQNVDKATEYLREKGMLEIQNGKEILIQKEGMQVWCMFDRDRDASNEDGKTTAFNDSISAAQGRGIHVAWSNDDFELWILLHFEEIDVSDPAYEHRSKYYERLTLLLRSSLASDVDGNRIVSNQRFSYKETMKTENKFVRFTLQLLKGKSSFAVSRAKKIEAFHGSGEKTPSQKVPCTMVHHLCAAILEAGGIEI